MSLSHRYRNFGGIQPPTEGHADQENEVIEDQKLQAFDAGYQAGWDDCIKARSQEKDQVTAELSQNLLDISFTYHEALSKLTLSMEPAITQIVEKLLPEIVRTALGAHIIEQVQGALKEYCAHPLEITVAPENMAAIEEILGKSISEPFEIVGDETLGEGQAFLKVGSNERQIDLDSLLEGVSTAMAAFFHASAKELGNG